MQKFKVAILTNIVSSMNLKLRIDHVKAVILPALHPVHPIHLLKKIGTVLREFPMNLKL